MDWYGRIKCFLGLHQFHPIRFVWVRFKSPVYYDGEYPQEGEIIVSVLVCTCCNKRIEIDVKK